MRKVRKVTRKRRVVVVCLRVFVCVSYYNSCLKRFKEAIQETVTDSVLLYLPIKVKKYRKRLRTATCKTRNEKLSKM